ncbi:MAG: type II and III secretion system protein [bacterium]|nr:type II and III secretion system protein [bacterium]
MKKVLLIIFLLNNLYLCISQNDIGTIRLKFDEMSINQPGLNEFVISDVTGLSLYSFITTLALEHKLNVDVDNELTTIIESNYFNVPVKEVFLFLIQKYDLEIDFINQFIVFNKKPPVIIPDKKPLPKEIDIDYKAENDFLSVNLKNDSISAVARTITEKSGKNIIVSPEVKDVKITGYFQNRPFDNIMEMVGQSNNLLITANENGSYLIEKLVLEGLDNNASRSTKNKSKPFKSDVAGNFDISVSENGFLNINSFNGVVSDILMEAAELLQLNYYLYSVPNDITVTLVAKQITFEDFLEISFRGKDYTYNNNENGFYFIGKRTEEGLRSTELIQMENRTIETVLESIPAELKKGIELKEFPELNGLVVSGSKPAIKELRAYLYEIDKVVPMVQLEVFIVQYNKSHDIKTGLKAGLDSERQTTSGVLFPTTDVNVNAQSTNGLIDIFNGFGVFNLGKVAQNFYLNLQFLENNSIIKIESTPKISTLSGHEAKLTIGETSYYFTQQNNFVPLGNNNAVTQSGTWTPSEANLNVTIVPYVSKDEQVTLKLSVEKSSFLGRAGENAPPGKATQRFDSEIRVRNNEMILLGGLDELSNENSGTGTPLISRIPILKWFFSSRSKNKSKSKLHILIKPTVTY